MAAKDVFVKESVNGVHGGGDGKKSPVEIDPEFEAELEYAREHGLPNGTVEGVPGSQDMKSALRKSKSADGE